ncbi:hypothetical protein PsYK624_091280 [Phanerochaete sordida]|uniref:Uncharacterized protein n=1 Tax=Phanerochaete sordida TaxID=48140 RepID=A0A9P3GEP4_9APHY|nr:hypothetical protein PsYK624_091280 [Phanerochaete sordida]
MESAASWVWVVGRHEGRRATGSAVEHAQAQPGRQVRVGGGRASGTSSQTATATARPSCATRTPGSCGMATPPTTRSRSPLMRRGFPRQRGLLDEDGGCVPVTAGRLQAVPRAQAVWAQLAETRTLNRSRARGTATWTVPVVSAAKTQAAPAHESVREAWRATNRLPQVCNGAGGRHGQSRRPRAHESVRDTYCTAGMRCTALAVRARLAVPGDISAAAMSIRRSTPGALAAGCTMLAAHAPLRGIGRERVPQGGVSLVLRRLASVCARSAPPPHCTVPATLRVGDDVEPAPQRQHNS